MSARPYPGSRWRAIPFLAAPAGVACAAVYLFYRASQLDGGASERAFGLGLLLALCAAAFVWGRAAHVHAVQTAQLEADVAQLRRCLDEVSKEQVALREDVHSRIAVQHWLEVFDRVDAHTERGWVHLNRPE